MRKELTYCFYILTVWENDSSKANHDSNAQRSPVQPSRVGPPALCSPTPVHPHVPSPPGPGDLRTGTYSKMTLGGSRSTLIASLRMGLVVCEDLVLISMWKTTRGDTTRQEHGEVTKVKETWFLHCPLLQGAWTSCSDSAFFFAP